MVFAECGNRLKHFLFPSIFFQIHFGQQRHTQDQTKKKGGGRAGGLVFTFDLIPLFLFALFYCCFIFTLWWCIYLWWGIDYPVVNLVFFLLNFPLSFQEMGRGGGYISSLLPFISFFTQRFPFSLLVFPLGVIRICLVDWFVFLSCLSNFVNVDGPISISILLNLHYFHTDALVISLLSLLLCIMVCDSTSLYVYTCFYFPQNILSRFSAPSPKVFIYSLTSCHLPTFVLYTT